MLSSLAKWAYCQATRGCLGIIQKMKWQPGSKTYAPIKLLRATNLNCIHVHAVQKRGATSECWQKQKADPKGLTKKSLRKRPYTERRAELRTHKGWWYPGPSSRTEPLPPKAGQRGKRREQPGCVWGGGLEACPKTQSQGRQSLSKLQHRQEGAENKHPGFSPIRVSTCRWVPDVAAPARTPVGKEARAMPSRRAAS